MGVAKLLSSLWGSWLSRGRHGAQGGWVTGSMGWRAGERCRSEGDEIKNVGLGQIFKGFN